MPTTFSYSAFGLAVDSELELDGFVPRNDARAPDVTVMRGTPAANGNEGQHAMAYAQGVLSARVEDGRRLVVSPDDGADPRYVSAVITGELFSVVLRQRGLAVVHGSAVAKDGRAVGFVGDSGWGKSTLAASLVERGWRLMTDDLLVVGGLGTDAPPTAIPTHPSMRLSEEAFAQVDGAGVRKGRAHAMTSKLRVDQAATFAERPAPLARIWLLMPGTTDEHASEPLSGVQAVHELVRHTRGKRLLGAPSFKAMLLRQCADLARRVPVHALYRRYGLEHIGSLCDLVEAEA